MVVNEETGCWEWVGGKSHNGYGHTTYKGKFYRAHRREQSAKAKLTDSDVIMARADYAAGRTQRSIAAQLGVTVRAISYAISRRTWKHLP